MSQPEPEDRARLIAAELAAILASPAAEYATRPERHAAGAITILNATISHASEAAALAAKLNGDYEGAAHDRQTLALIALRLEEAQLLAGALA